MHANALLTFNVKSTVQNKHSNPLRKLGPQTLFCNNGVKEGEAATVEEQHPTPTAARNFSPSSLMPAPQWRSQESSGMTAASSSCSDGFTSQHLTMFQNKHPEDSRQKPGQNLPADYLPFPAALSKDALISAPGTTELAYLPPVPGAWREPLTTPSYYPILIPLRKKKSY